MGKISEHISYNEAIRSELAKRNSIDNTPEEGHLIKMKELANAVFEPLRLRFGVPIYISSFFRSVALNKALKGAKNSQHMAMYGAAMDLDADVYGEITNKDIFDYIKDNFDYDQLILENVGDDGTGGWVHVSYIAPVSIAKNRNQTLKMSVNKEGKKIYETIT